MRLKQWLRHGLHACGYDLGRYETLAVKKKRKKQQRVLREHHLICQLLERYQIDLVLDVGANRGQYSTMLRDIGYRGRIVSFEPLSSVYAELQTAAQHDPLWQTVNSALGSTNGVSEINVANLSYSSSLLEMLPAHVEAAPETAYIGKETIQVNTLDAIFPTYCSPEQHIWLKVDTQGYEQDVLAGAADSLGYIDTVQLEMSFVPLYQDAWLFPEMYRWMNEQGYRLVSLETAFRDHENDQILQVDGIFHRPAAR